MTKRKHEDTSSKQTHNKKKHKKHDSDFNIVRASTVVSIPPVFASNPREGVLEMLDSMIMRYIPSFEGVVLTHSNLQFLQSTALIQYDCPFAKCSVAFDATVWSPSVGQRLSGKVILSSPDHISLLIHRTFNVSIPRHHIPSEKCNFQWGSAGNDDGVTNMEDNVTMANGEEDDAAKDADEDADAVEGENLGSWIDNETGKPLGPILEFTVIGLTIANQMLSIIGSLQPDPFSTRHAPPAAVAEEKGKDPRGDEDQGTSQEEEEDAIEIDAPLNTRSEHGLESSDEENETNHRPDKSKASPRDVAAEPKPRIEKRSSKRKLAENEEAKQDEKKKKKKAKT